MVAVNAPIWFNFEYRGRAYLNAVCIAQPGQNLPSQGEVIFFCGAEERALHAMGLPAGAWRINIRAFDYEDGKLNRVTMTVMPRNAAQEGSRAGKAEEAQEVAAST